MTADRGSSWRRGAVVAGALLIGAPALVAGPLVATGGAAPASEANPAGRALGTGVFATYSDQENFFPGAATVPPSTWAPLATGGFENNGVGFARAAFAYNPYQDAPGAVNALTPPGSPPLPFDELNAAGQASVQGEAPQSRDASLASEAGLPGGTVRAGLDEDGPAAVSEVVAADLVPADGVTVTAVTSRSRVSKAAGHAVSEATTVLEGVSVAGVLTFDTIAVEASSAADGGPGDASAAVRVNGVAVNGTPVVITDHQGLVASGNNVPLNAAPIAETLNAAGLELLAPGRSSLEPAGSNSTAEARGPSFRLTTSDNRKVELVLGLASAASVLFDVNEDPAALPVAEDADDDGATAGATDTDGPVPVTRPASGAADGSTTPPEGRGVPVPARPSPRSDRPRLIPTAPAAGSPWPAAAPSASHDEAAAAPVQFAPAPAAAPALTLQPAGLEATSRVNGLYAVLAVAGGALLLVALAVPPGDRWAEDS